MTTMAVHVILARADNHPPMLDKSQYNSWQSLIHSYINKLEKDMHSTNFDQLYAYLRQHEAHANEVRLMMQRFPDPSCNECSRETNIGVCIAVGGRGNATSTRVNRNVGTLQTGREKAIFQNDDRDSFDSNCNEAPSASVVLMAKLSAYDSDYSEQPPFINGSDIDITSDSNVISYDQYLQETENEVVQDTTSFVQQDAMIMYVIEEMSNQVAKCNEVNKENRNVNKSLIAELERYKEQSKNYEEETKI
ncbi:hypothetical protein Tco_0623124 [Tanacetum coccineum]